jgi:NAD(P)-dependent dehydrogenase (short-subunit alcohol dehydrogenase family)
MLIITTTRGSEVIYIANNYLVVITGPSMGSIGGATALALAHGKPKTLFLTGRNLQKIAPVIEEIKRVDANIEAVFVEMDLMSLQSVREAASFIIKSRKAEKIHGLINNAGIMATPFGTTKEGVEQQFGVVRLCSTADSTTLDKVLTRRRIISVTFFSRIFYFLISLLRALMLELSMWRRRDMVLQTFLLTTSTST